MSPEDKLKPMIRKRKGKSTYWDFMEKLHEKKCKEHKKLYDPDVVNIIIDDYFDKVK